MPSTTFIYDGAGELECSYLEITQVGASPSSTWFALHSVDGGDTSGWTFVDDSASLVPTAASIVSSVLCRLDENPEAPVFWSRSEILALVNEGYYELNLIAILVLSTTSIARPSSNVIGIPESAMVPVAVFVGNNALGRTTVESMDLGSPSWQSATGSPSEWAPVGITKIAFSKYPTSAGATASLTTLDLPPELEEDTELPIGGQYLLALENYAFHAARFKEGGAEFQQAMPAYADFLLAAGYAFDQTDARTFDLLGKGLVGTVGISYDNAITAPKASGLK